MALTIEQRAPRARRLARNPCYYCHGCMLNYNHLYYFHVAATEGTLAAAAAKLGVKQSTISEQLRSLERALAQKLFERSSGGLRLTKAGQIAYERTTAMFRESDRLLQSLGTDQAAPPRALRVGTSSAVARSTSADFLLPLFAIDDCMPTIATGETIDLLRHLRANDLDLVLCESEPPDATVEGLQRAVVDHTPLVAIAGVNADPGPDWQDGGLIQYRSGSTLNLEVEAFLEAGKLRPRIVGEADDPFLLVEAAASGGYIAVVPRSVARDAVSVGRVRVLAQIEAARSGVHAVYQDGAAAELARHAIEKLIERARTTA